MNANSQTLCIMPPKMTGYVKYFDKSKYISLLIKDDDLFIRYNKVWDKVGNSNKKRFGSKPVYNEKYLK